MKPTHKYIIIWLGTVYPYELFTSLMRPSKRGYIRPWSEFQNLLFHVYWGRSHVAIGILLLYLYFSLCCCRGFNPSLCHLLPFLLSYVTVSRPCCLSEFYLNRVIINAGTLGLKDSLFIYQCIQITP